jgi:hypothetical protein
MKDMNFIHISLGMNKSVKIFHKFILESIDKKITSFIRYID